MPDSTKTGNGTHDANMLKANHDWQVAIAAAGGSASAIRTADINFYTTKLASARANGLVEPAVTAIQALRDLRATVPT